MLKPFLETTTFRNLTGSRTAVVNLTDDVMLFARAAISSPSLSLGSRDASSAASCSRRPARGARWRSPPMDATPPRSRIETPGRASRVSAGVPRVQPRPPRGPRGGDPGDPHPPDPGRARSAAELERLQVIVDKTAGPREQEAMALLTEYVRCPLACSSRPRPGSTSASSTCAARSGGGSADSARRCRRRHCSSRLRRRRPSRPRARCGARGGVRPPIPRAPRPCRRSRARRAPGDPGPQRARLRHPARPRGGPGPGRAVRPPDRAAGPRAGGGAGAALGDRNLDIRAGRVHRGGRPAPGAGRRRAAAGPLRGPRALALRHRHSAGLAGTERGCRGRGVRRAAARRPSARWSGSRISCSCSCSRRWSEADLAGFGSALSEIQRITGAWFAPRQGGVFAPGPRAS